MNPVHGLCWWLTVGEDMVAVHTNPDQWGWHAGDPLSRRWLGVEFAQCKLGDPITDCQVRATAWAITNLFWERWPAGIPRFECHSQTEQGRQWGKTDPFPDGDPRNDDLIARILKLL